MKQYLPENCGNSKKQKKQFINYAPYLQALLDIQEALLNMADVMADLWPEDDTPRILFRVLVHYNYGAAIKGTEAERCRFISDFCDCVLRDNACRALVTDPPLSFRRVKERWADMAERCTANTAVAATSFNNNHQGQQNSSNRGRGGGRGGGGGAAGAARAGNSTKGRVARYFVGGTGYAVCFDYNKAGGCTRRTAKGCGCDDGRGGVFAHACNYFDTSTGKWCLALHGRDGNH